MTRRGTPTTGDWAAVKVYCVSHSNDNKLNHCRPETLSQGHGTLRDINLSSEVSIVRYTSVFIYIQILRFPYSRYQPTYVHFFFDNFLDKSK